jgi:hypothetical protein
MRKKFVEHFADVYRDHPWTGSAQGTLETRRLEPRQIRAGGLRFDPDELVLDKGKLVIVDVRIKPAPAKPEDGAIDALVAAASVEEAPAKHEPVILVLKRLFPPDGLRPKGRSVKWVTSSLNTSATWKPPSKNNPQTSGAPMARPTKNTPTKLPKSSKAASAAGQAKGRGGAAGAGHATSNLNGRSGDGRHRPGISRP